MAMPFGALRDALIDAGASPEKAIKVAEELAAHRSRRSPTLDNILPFIVPAMLAGLFALCCIDATIMLALERIATKLDVP